ncbi:cytochrome c-type biogenesis protein CcmH [Calidifontibacillus oryziterrae]|uniref:cytochrome c-type biogenesis protein CcmH n=1 Tax=Calidifontibacillus oryziterrae TaxID=1191699 RepID=UPI0003707AF7|nr:cytochrome c-type biogenesis protein CcmH [Calidifontibacillus oryziterrae]
MKFRLFSLLIPILLLSNLFGNNILAVEEFDYSRKDFQEVVSMLDMEGHGNDDLATCNVKQLYYEEVAEMMTNGMNKDEILDYYVDQMGEEALKAPLKQGFSLTAWITPFIILLLATVLVYYIIQRLVKLRQTEPEIEVKHTAVDETENEILLSIVEEERKKYF